MAKTQDLNKIVKDAMGAFPVDMGAAEEAFKTQATLNEKMTGVALQAADKSTELSTKWAKQTLAKLSDVAKANEDPAGYSKAMADFTSAQAELVAENLAAFAEIAKNVQMETVELMTAAGKGLGEDAAAAFTKASADAVATAQKATNTK